MGDRQNRHQHQQYRPRDNMGGGGRNGRDSGNFHDRRHSGQYDRHQQNGRQYDGHSRQQQQHYDNRRNGHGHGGQQFDRRRRHDDYDEGPAAKRQFEQIPEKQREPKPIEFEVECVIDGQNKRFCYKEKEPFPEKLSAIHCVRIHGQIEQTLPLNNDMVMFLGNCGTFFKSGATLKTEDNKMVEGLVMHCSNVKEKMKTISQALLGNCEFLELDENRLNLLQLPLFSCIPEMKVIVKGKSYLEVNSGGMNALFDWLHGRNGTKKKGSIKKLDFEAKGPYVAREFVRRIKLDKTDDAQFIVRITCPSPSGSLFEFVFAPRDKNSRIEMTKENGDTAFILRKFPLEQTSTSAGQLLQIRDHNDYPKLPKISITNMEKPEQ